MSSLPRPQSDHQPFDAIVIGAGIAGLGCAQSLFRSGVNVLVVEASDHLGGRCRTVRESDLRAFPEGHLRWMRVHRPKDKSNVSRPLGADNFGFEVGAEFIHGMETPLGSLLKEHNVELKELFTWAHGDGGPSEHPAPDGGIGMYWVGAEKRLIRFDAEEPEHKHMVEVLWGLGARKDVDNDRRSLHQFLKDEGVSDRFIGMAEAGYANTVGGTLRKISVAQMCQCERNWENDGEEDFRVGNGSTLEETAVRALAAGLDVRRNLPVSKVELGPDGIFTVYSPRAGGTAFRARHVVVAVPIPALQRNTIKFNPPLPAEKVAAIGSLECEPALKIHMKFTHRFWPEKLHGTICSDAFVPELWFDEHSGCHYVTAFFTSDQARRVGALDTDVAFESCLQQLSEMFGVDPRPHYCGGFLLDWGRVPHIWGGYTMPSLKELPDARETLSKQIGRLHFAGEATHAHAFMTAHAALSTGIRAADEIMGLRAPRKVAPMPEVPQIPTPLSKL
jgi:monoamine oxidase